MLDRAGYGSYAVAFHDVFQQELPVYIGVDAIFNAVYRASETLLADVERLRTATIALRGAPTAARRRRVVAIVDALDLDRAEDVIRAFTCYFQLVNLAEERERVRVLRDRSRSGKPVMDSIAALEVDGSALVDVRITPVLTAHPTTAREHRSRITARYSQPSAVHRYVISVTHAVSGAATANCRANTLGATGSAWLESVVTRNRRRGRAHSACWRMSRATRLRPSRCPRCSSSACTRGLP